MSSVVCQGLQSCLEMRITETKGSRHKLSPSRTIISQPLISSQYSNMLQQNQHKNDSSDDKSSINNNYDDLKSTENSDKGGWNFIQALTNPSYNTKDVTDQTEKVYVHPLAKRSASALSSKGLEMCTESLGCETGSDISSDEISSFSWEREKMELQSDDYSSLYSEKSLGSDEFSSVSTNKSRCNYRKFTKLYKPKCDFPPPLTSISGSDSVEVRPHREGGRLIINAVAVSSCRTYFEADRTNGRLKLSLMRECSAACDCEMNKNMEEEVYNNEDEEQVLEHEHVSEVAEDEADEDRWDEDMEENKRIVMKMASEIFLCQAGAKKVEEEAKGCQTHGDPFGLPFLEIYAFYSELVV